MTGDMRNEPQSHRGHRAEEHREDHISCLLCVLLLCVLCDSVVRCLYLGASAVSDRNAIARRTVGGVGASGPMTACQRISFSSKSSIRSTSLKSILAERSAPYDAGVFFASRLMRATSQAYGRRS